MKRIYFLPILFLAALLPSCKKEKKPGSSTSIDLLKDSLYLYEKEDYLWNDAIPSASAFNPDSYSSNNDLSTLSSELFAISQLKINTATNKPYEYYRTDPTAPKYSFVDDGTETASLNGTNGDFGFAPVYIQVNDLRIKYVYPNSPAALAGLQRGDMITSINGNGDLVYDNGGNVNFVVNAVFYSPSISLTVTKLDGTTLTVSLNTAKYTVNPVLTYKVFSPGNGRKVAYMAFNSFTALSNAQPYIDAAFTYFAAQGANELVVDLRYNGGGATETAEYLDNLIVPAAENGTLMYTSYFNTGLQGNNFPLLAKKYAIGQGSFAPANNQIYFAKKMSLALNRVFFIVTNETASSSELAINNLLPELSVQLIGDTTYGKPVGEIPIPIGSQGKYTIYSPQYYVLNSAGNGNYYSGMAPGSVTYPGLLAADDVTKEFGDSTEMLLAHALNYVKSGSYAVVPQTKLATSGGKAFSLYQQKTIVRSIQPNWFKPMALGSGKLKARR